MAQINLLPWRENLRKQRQREFGVAIVGMAVITALLLVVGHIHIASMITHQNSRNAFLKKEITAVESKIKEIKNLESTKAKLLARMDVIQELQSSRPGVVHLFDELVKTVPEGALLTNVTQNGKNIQIDGRAQSNARVSAYMRKIEASDWLEKPQLLVIETKDKTGTGLNHFRMSAQQTNPNRGND